LPPPPTTSLCSPNVIIRHQYCRLHRAHISEPTQESCESGRKGATPTTDRRWYMPPTGFSRKIQFRRPRSHHHAVTVKRTRRPLYRIGYYIYPGIVAGIIWIITAAVCLTTSFRVKRPDDFSDGLQTKSPPPSPWMDIIN